MTIRFIIPAGVALALMVTACGEKKAPETPRADTTHAAAPQPGTLPAPSTAPPPPAAAEPDTSDGTLTITGTGAMAGTWKFNDVTATMDEQPMNGVTQSVLTIQAHDGPAQRHLRFRLTRDNAPIETGAYSIEAPGGTPPRNLNVRFEVGKAMFTSLQNAKGSVTLRSVKGDRAVGSFEVALNSMESGGGTETLKGNFDLKYGHY